MPFRHGLEHIKVRCRSNIGEQELWAPVTRYFVRRQLSYLFFSSLKHIIFKRFVLCFREFPLLLDLQQNGNIGCHGDARGSRNDL